MANRAPSADVSTGGLSPIDGTWTLTGLGVNNLRALRMKRRLDLRRLMLVVGRNGIGKSTFARVFPLLRQSAGSRTREPLLWWERDQVDFGSFDEACRRGESAIRFSFAFTDRHGLAFRVSTTLEAGPEGSRVAKVDYYGSGRNRCTLTFDEAGGLRTVEGRLGGREFQARQARTVARLVPDLHSEPWQLFGVPDQLTPDGPLRMLADAFHGNMSLDRRIEVIASLDWRRTNEVEESLRQQQFGAKYKREVEACIERRGWSARLQRSLFCWHSIQRLQLAERLVDTLARRTAYLGPFRAVPERSYRHQSVAVEQLDARGANLAMFISALTDGEKRSLNTFLSKWLDFRVYSKRTGGQYALEIDTAGQRYNLLDVGFGYSQILPVAVQLWASTRASLSTSRTDERLAVMVVEQPELHLHPHHQVLVAQAMAAAAMADDGPMQLIETHSDHLVGEIGLLIAGGRLDPERVGVLCVEPHFSGTGAVIKMATFDEDGVLQGWPAGFLAP